MIFHLELQILDKFKPKMIFTAHSHYSRVITYPPQHVENIVDSRVVTIHLNGLRNFSEISVPTSSYRMGVSKIGYGYAVIGKLKENTNNNVVRNHIKECLLDAYGFSGFLQQSALNVVDPIVYSKLNSHKRT